MRTFDVLFGLLRQHRSSPGTLFDEALAELEAQVKELVDPDPRIYPCAAEGCDVMRSKAEGGNIFTVCDKHWDEAQPDEKPEHMKLCSELMPYVCYACGKQTCFKHGLPLAEEHQGKWQVETKTPRRCTPCADAGR